MGILYYYRTDAIQKNMAGGSVTWMVAADGVTQQNVIGAVGYYSITVNLSGSGEDGDTIFYTIVRHTSSGALEVGPLRYASVQKGIIGEGGEFKIRANSGDSIFVRVSAVAQNARPIVINSIKTDSYLIS